MILDFLRNLFSRPTAGLSSAQLIEAGVCPNCWGKMQYDSKYQDYLKDATKDNVSGRSDGRKSFVLQFIETHVDGIKLKKDGDKLDCPKCSTTYKANRAGGW